MSGVVDEPMDPGRRAAAGLGAAAVVVALVGCVPVGGAIASLGAHGAWVWPSKVTRSLVQVAIHAKDPALAYAPAQRADVPGPVVFWSVVGVLAGVVLMVSVIAAVWVVSRQTRPGLATRAQMKKAMDFKDCTPAYSDYKGVPVKARTGDAALVVAPQQSGKTTRIAAAKIKDAPGAVVATSTKADLVDLTIFSRLKDGQDREVLVFDLDGVTSWPACARWNMIAGCERAVDAAARAKAMVAARPLGKEGGGNVSFFTDSAATVLKCLMHAAAVDGRTMRDVMRWARNFADDEALQILDAHPAAIPGWVDDLRQQTQGQAPETVSSTATTVQLVLGALADPAVLDMVCPTDFDEGIDLERFLARGRDTLYLCSEGGAHVSTAPIVTALASALVTTARRASQQRPSRKLDPILTLVLDEAANVAPLPELGTLMTDGGGRGISTWAFVQSFGQLRERWGADTASTLWGGTSLRMLLGGCQETDDLDRISRRIGDRWARRRSYNNAGIFSAGNGGSVSESFQETRILPVREIAELEVGQALLLYRNMPAAIVHVPAWWERPDKADFARSQQESMTATGRV